MTSELVWNFMQWRMEVSYRSSSIFKGKAVIALLDHWRRDRLSRPETPETDYHSTTRKTREESRLQLYTFSYETREYTVGAEPLYRTKFI